MKTPTITIVLTEEQHDALTAHSEKLDLPVEDVVRVAVEQFLEQPESEVENAMAYILKKNHELYRRLA